MNIRIALLFIGVLVSASSGAAPADATKPLDPDQAPIAAVDQFGDKAATIQVRSADNHLPGPNEPVDFDTGPSSRKGCRRARASRCAITISTSRDDTGAGLRPVPRGRRQARAGQLDIVDTLPGEKGYNDFRQVWKVSVPKDYVANTITDAGALSQAGYKSKRPIRCVTCRWCPTSRSHVSA